MKRHRLAVAVAIAVSGLVLFAVAYATAQEKPHQQMQMGQHLNGKKATFTLALDSPYKFGGFTLKPGTYEFQHRVVDGNHLVYFTSLKGRPVSPGGVRCEIEPLSAKASGSSMTSIPEGDARRITRLVVSGEKVAHVFAVTDTHSFRLDPQ